MSTSKDALSQSQNKVKELEGQIAELEKKVKSLKGVIEQLSQEAKAQSMKDEPPLVQKKEAPVVGKKEAVVKKEEPAQSEPQLTEEIRQEIRFTLPIIANSHKIMDRLTLVDQLKQHLPNGMSFFVPTKPTLEYLLAAKTETIALALPPLQLPKVKLSEYVGPQGEEVCKYGFDLERVDGQPLSQEQRQWLIARYLVKLEGCDVFVNTVLVQEELAQLQQQKATRKPSLSDEQMLDVAEVCFVRIAEILSKHGITVREVFQKYAVTEMLPESKTVLEMIVPTAFFEAIRNDLGLRELSDLEAACMLRVLSKPELGNAIVLNEFALIMENFGVPLLETTLSDDPPLAEEEYTPDGAEQPRTYNLASIDEDGTLILQAVARYLLKEYLHPREFFGKMIKPNQEVKTEKKTYKLDLLS